MKYPHIQLYTGDWLKDPNLRRCSIATRGVWIDLVCLMHESDRSGTLTASLQQFARLAGCSESEVKTAIDELETSGTADVQQASNGIVTVVNRRMKRLFDERLASGERVKKHRSNTTVTAFTDIDNDNDIPSNLNNEAFRAAYSDWIRHRIQLRKPLTMVSVKQQIARCSEWGSDRAVIAVRYSLEKGWVGIFEPTTTQGTYGKGTNTTVRPENVGADLSKYDGVGTTLPAVSDRARSR